MNRRLAVLLGLVTATCAASGFVACSSSTSGGGGGEDAGNDHSTSGDSSTTGDSSTKDSTTADTGNPAEGGPAEGGPAEGGPGEGGQDASDGGATCAVYDASGLDEASVQAGFMQVWEVYKCFKCHQNPTDLVDDAGNGILLNGNTVGLGDSGTIFPPNLTNSAVALGCWSDPQIQTAILQGRDNEGGALCPPMPVFGNAGNGAGRPMDAGTAQEIVDYLRSLQPSNQTTPDTTCASPEGGTDGGAGDGASDAPEDAPDAG